jgi:hypothetical protein
MHHSIIAVALLVSFASSAHAGGMHVRIEGPGPDGITYTARTLDLRPGDTWEPWASAEGVVAGKIQSRLIKLIPTGEPGVYQFTRTWPNEGRWMIRYSMGHPPAPATIAALRADGTVRSNKLYPHSDGFQECFRALRKVAKVDPKEDC